MKTEFTLEFKEEMATQKADIIATTNNYVLKLNSNLHDVLRNQMAEFSKLISMALTGEEGEP